MNILGVALGVLSLVASAVFYWLSRTPKRVEYAVGPLRRLLLPNVHEARGLSVRYGDEVLADPHTVDVDIRNVGKTPARPEDFHVPISIKCSNTDVIAADVVAAPDTFPRPALSLASRATCEVAPVLINPNEWFRVQLLLRGMPQDVRVTARIAGIDFKAERNRQRDRGSLASRTVNRFPGATSFGIAVIASAVAALTFGLLISVDRATVPALEGKTVQEAIPILEDRDLHLTSIACVESPGAGGRVVAQRPGPGTSVSAGGEVSIVIEDDECPAQ